MTVQERRKYYVDTYGSVRIWAMLVVSDNWRVRKRLPRITTKAEQLGYISQ